MKKKYRLYLGNDEHDVLIRSLIECKNELMAKGKYDAQHRQLLMQMQQRHQWCGLHWRISL